MGVTGSKKQTAASSSDEDSYDSDDNSDASSTAERRPARPSRATAAATREALRLEPPAFSMNNGELDPNRYELWSFRLPSSIPIQDLDGCEMTIPAAARDSTAGGTLSAPSGKDNGNSTTSSNGAFSFATQKGENYTMRWGHKVENESFRVLVPNNDDDDDMDDDDDDDDNKKKKFLSPANATFQRHINVASVVEEVSETKLAPGRESAPTPDLVTRGIQHSMRRAYKHVPQKTGLKRRWMPLGARGGGDLAEAASRPQSSSASHVLLEKQKRKRSMSGADDLRQPEGGKRKLTGSQQLLIDNAAIKEVHLAATKFVPNLDGAAESKAAKKARKAAEKEQKKMDKQSKKDSKKSKKEKKLKKEEV